MLTETQIKLVIDVLADRVVQLKGKNGTEWTQVQLTDAIVQLNRELSVIDRLSSNSAFIPLDGI